MLRRKHPCIIDSTIYNYVVIYVLPSLPYVCVPYDTKRDTLQFCVAYLANDLVHHSQFTEDSSCKSAGP